MRKASNKEHFWVFSLNQANKILNRELVSMGGRKATTVDAAEVFRIPLLKSATRIILVHNHPGGTVTPSQADTDLTNRLQKVGDLLEVQVDDHIIVTKRAFLSFTENGIMKDLAWSTKYALSFVYEKKIRKEMADLKKKIDLERGRGVQEGLKEGTKRGKKEGKAALAELLLKYGGTKNFKQYFNHNEGAIFELINASTYSDEAFFYIWDQSGIPLEELSNKLTSDTKQRIMSGLQQMRQQSMEQGIQQGMERGMEKGIQHEKQEVVRTLTRFAEKGKISQETMQDILKEI